MCSFRYNSPVPPGALPPGSFFLLPTSRFRAPSPPLCFVSFSVSLPTIDRGFFLDPFSPSVPSFIEVRRSVSVFRQKSCKACLWFNELATPPLVSCFFWTPSLFQEDPALPARVLYPRSHLFWEVSKKILPVVSRSPSSFPLRRFSAHR